MVTLKFLHDGRKNGSTDERRRFDSRSNFQKLGNGRKGPFWKTKLLSVETWRKNSQRMPIKCSCLSYHIQRQLCFKKMKASPLKLETRNGLKCLPLEGLGFPIMRFRRSISINNSSWSFQGESENGNRRLSEQEALLKARFIEIIHYAFSITFTPESSSLLSGRALVI